MKHNDVLHLLEKTNPGVFSIEVCFRDRTVLFSSRKGLWEYDLDYAVFEDSSPEKIVEEVLYEYNGR